MRQRLLVLALAAGAGLCLAASVVPPLGWWPLAVVGVMLWDRLLADRGAWSRFRRSWLVGAFWLFPSMLWMYWLTAPGYLIASAVFAAYFGVAAMAVPGAAPARWLALPAAITLADAARSAFPFEGVPLSTVAMSQAGGPLAPTVRFGSALFLALLVGVCGVGLSAALDRRWRAAGAAGAFLVASLLFAVVAPRGHVVDQLEVAVVQGGGPQGTRASETNPREVVERHLDASEEVEPPVDLVLWPENVVNVEGTLEQNPEYEELAALARDLDTTLVPGIVEGVNTTDFLNASIAFGPDGTEVARYDKVRRVPFGEWVPLRSFLEQFDSGLPRRDAVAGDGPAVLETPAGTFGVVISWEVFFADRAADGIANGGEVLLNPTNGASYTLTQVQSQQIASSRLRALETDRWVLQAAPTGYSAVIRPDGTIVARSEISERWVTQTTVERRRGLTLAVRFGPWPTLMVSIGMLAAAWVVDRRRVRPEEGPPTGS